MDEKEKQIAIKILDRILSNEGITNTDQYDGHLQFIYDELKAIPMELRVSPKNGDLENAITELIKYLTDDFLWAFKLDSDWLDEYRIIKRLLDRIETEKNILQR